MSNHRRCHPHKRLTALSFATRVWQAVDTPVSLSLLLMCQYGEFRQLVEKSINASDYLDPASFFLDYQSVKLLSRFPNLDTGIDTDLQAKKKFLEAEVLCRDTNDRVRTGGYVESPRVASVITRMQRKISSILGPVPSLSDLDFNFGPGAAFGVRGDTSAYKKITSGLECTYAFSDISSEFLGEFPGWIPDGVHEVRLVPGSQLSIVPKNAKTGRPICIEPLLNGLYQKGVGSWLRKRLMRFGVNLDDQGVNQALASSAIDKLLCTVDFSSASDTISYSLVLDLLPIDWFEFLEVARCPRYEIEGSWYNFHKFTSMGNAYTFELETLIFYAAATAVCEEMSVLYSTGETLSVYGDDVIIPRECFDLFQEVTEACGFKINKEKSFIDGPFFESCGHDFFLGTFVRPTLLSKEINTLPSSFHAANQILRICKTFRSCPSSYLAWGSVPSDLIVRRLTGVYDWVVGCVPPHLRVWGPEGYGDGHLVTDFLPEVTCRPPQWALNAQWDGVWFHSYVERPILVSLPEWPSSYALYHGANRAHSASRCYSRESLLLDNYVKVPEPLDNGTGYSVRSRTSLRRVKMFCHFIWHGIS